MHVSVSSFKSDILLTYFCEVDAIPIGQDYLDIISSYKYGHGHGWYIQNLTFHVGYDRSDIAYSVMVLPNYLD